MKLLESNTNASVAQESQHPSVQETRKHTGSGSPWDNPIPAKNQAPTKVKKNARERISTQMDNTHSNGTEQIHQPEDRSTSFDFCDTNTELELDDVKYFNNINVTNTCLVMHVNIRNMSKNFNEFEIYIKRLQHRPHVIVCTETWYWEHYNIFQIDNYNTYNNNSTVNKADGVIIFVDARHSIVLEQIGNISFLSCIIEMNNINIKVTGLSRCYDVDKPSFIANLNE